MQGTKHLTADVDAHYSPDDGGWYLHDYVTNKTSGAIYETASVARAAFVSGRVVWR